MHNLCARSMRGVAGRKGESRGYVGAGNPAPTLSTMSVCDRANVAAVGGAREEAFLRE